MTKMEEARRQVITSEAVTALGLDPQGSTWGAFISSLEAFERAVRDEEAEECAAIPDKWANSKSCEPNGRTCDHQRQGSTIAYKIRARIAARAKEGK